MHHSFQRDNLCYTHESRKAHFTRVTEVVESCQMCWISNGMQHICNKYATQISMICIGHFQRNLGMSFSLLYFIGNCDFLEVKKKHMFIEHMLDKLKNGAIIQGF